MFSLAMVTVAVPGTCAPSRAQARPRVPSPCPRRASSRGGTRRVERAGTSALRCKGNRRQHAPHVCCTRAALRRVVRRAGLTRHDAAARDRARPPRSGSAALAGGAPPSATIRTYRSALSTWREEAPLGGWAQPRSQSSPSSVRARASRATSREAERCRAPARPSHHRDDAPLLAELEPHCRSARGGAPQDCHDVGSGLHGDVRAAAPERAAGLAQHRDRALRPAADRPSSSRAGSAAAQRCPSRRVPRGRTRPRPLHHRARRDQGGQVGAQPRARRGGAPRGASALALAASAQRSSAPPTGASSSACPAAGALLSGADGTLSRLWSSALGQPRPHLTGKAFRRGGASGLMAAGAARPDIQAAGRWRSAAMLETYSSARGQERAREIAVSRGMAP